MVKLLDPTKCYLEIRTNKKTGKVKEGPYRGKVIRQFTEGSGDGTMAYIDFSTKEGVEDGDYSGREWVEFKEVECKGNDVPPPANIGTIKPTKGLLRRSYGNRRLPIPMNKHGGHIGGRKTCKRKTKKSRKTRK
jgi:hypothetical protein